MTSIPTTTLYTVKRYDMLNVLVPSSVSNTAMANGHAMSVTQFPARSPQVNNIGVVRGGWSTA